MSNRYSEPIEFVVGIDTGVTMVECRDCGAWVSNTHVHDDHHRRITIAYHGGGLLA